MKVGTRIIIRQRDDRRTLWPGLVNQKGSVIRKHENHAFYKGKKWVRVRLDMDGKTYHFEAVELEVIRPIKLKKFSAWK